MNRDTRFSVFKNRLSTSSVSIKHGFSWDGGIATDIFSLNRQRTRRGGTLTEIVSPTIQFEPRATQQRKALSEAIW